MVISGSTRLLTGGMFDYRDLGRVALKALADLQDSALYPSIIQLERAAGFTRDDTIAKKGANSMHYFQRHPRPLLI
jgi:hypothetical protein